METIFIKGKPHYIFDSREEYEKYFMDKDNAIPPLKENWKEADVGDWVLADDGGVCQILYVGTMKYKNNTTKRKWNRYVRTAIGSYACSKHIKMDTDKSLHKNRFRFGLIGKGKIRLTRKEREFITYILAGQTLRDAYIKTYGDSEVWFENAIDILRRPLVMAEIRKSAKEVADSLGITLEWIFQKYKEFAENSKSEAVKLNAVKELAEILDVAGEMNTTRKIGGFSGFSQRELKEAEIVEEE